MKVGSLVECIGMFGSDQPVSYPKMNRVYTVRELEEHIGFQFICVEEIHNRKIAINGVMEEPLFDARAFREVQAPASISIEEIMKAAD